MVVTLEQPALLMVVLVVLVVMVDLLPVVKRVYQA
jgi:hypothetical protein